MSTLIILYALATFIVAIYGLNGLIYAGVFVWYHWVRRLRTNSIPAALSDDLPLVTVQLPIFNERYVVEGLIDSAAALSYPADKLHIQVLDDSTDDTTAIARARVAQYRARGINIEYVQRPERTGYKAGALAYGLNHSQAGFVAVFDADFRPSSDFLLKVIPTFADESIGAVQTRWGHFNAEQSLITRAQAFALDAHFAIEQEVRSRTGLLMNFNGSAGVWRRAAIEDAGGWEADTIAEDLDLSYRAQLRGWRMTYLSDVMVPAEIPGLLGAVKRQQFRWAKGSIQCLMKNGGALVNSTQPLLRKVQGLMHLTGYIMHPMMMIIMVLSLPLVITGEISRAHIGALGTVGLGGPLAFMIAQLALYPKDWLKRSLFVPSILLLGPGMALNNTAAILEALLGRNSAVFLRTPKFIGAGQGSQNKPTISYGLPIDWTTWAEIFFMIYSGVTTAFAMQRAPGLAPFMASYAIGFGYTAWLGIKQSLEFNDKPVTRAATMD